MRQGVASNACVGMEKFCIMRIIYLAGLIGVGSRVPRDFHFHRNNGDAGTIAYVRGHMSRTDTHAYVCTRTAPLRLSLVNSATLSFSRSLFIPFSGAKRETRLKITFRTHEARKGRSPFADHKFDFHRSGVFGLNNFTL